MAAQYGQDQEVSSCLETDLMTAYIDQSNMDKTKRYPAALRQTLWLLTLTRAIWTRPRGIQLLGDRPYGCLHRPEQYGQDQEVSSCLETDLMAAYIDQSNMDKTKRYPAARRQTLWLLTLTRAIWQEVSSCFEINLCMLTSTTSTRPRFV